MTKKTRHTFFVNSKIDLNLDKYSNSKLELNYQKTSDDNYLKLTDLKSPLIKNNKDFLESKIQLDLESQNYSLTTSFEMYETLNGSNSDRYQYGDYLLEFQSIGYENLTKNINTIKL